MKKVMEWYLLNLNQCLHDTKENTPRLHLINKTQNGFEFIKSGCHGQNIKGEPLPLIIFQAQGIEDAIQKACAFISKFQDCSPQIKLCNSCLGNEVKPCNNLST
jgi:hypothetical protein